MSGQTPKGTKRWRSFFIFALILAAAGLGYETWRARAVPQDAPRIGVSLDTAWHSQLRLSSKTYEIALTRAGGRMVELRPGIESPAEIVAGLDALLLAGGGDVDPVLYGGDPDGAMLVDKARDDFELALIKAALARDIPILGICRGIQMLNVAHGGALRDHREDEAINERHGITTRSLRAHEVVIEQGSRLFEALKVARKQVNSFHGQSVSRLGSPLKAVARDPIDGIIEGIERSDRRFVVAIQWHPEILSLEDEGSLALFRALVREARRKP